MSSNDSIKTKRKRFAFKGFVRRKSKKSGSKRDLDDESTAAYSVKFDTSTRNAMGDGASTSAASASASELAKSLSGEPVTVILLVMDTKTRRFELLQLEFDSATAKVCDVFEQISVSATEASLKNQTYDRLISLKGEALVASKDLKEYIDPAGILIAVPASTVETSYKVAKMALPILTSPKVHSMLVASELEIPDLPPARETKKTEQSSRSLPLPSTPEEPADAKSPGKKQVAQEQKKAAAVEEAKPAPAVVVKEEKVQDAKTESKSEAVPAPAAATTKGSESSCGFSTFLSFAAMIAVIAHLAFKVHLHYTSPLGPGMKLSPGRTHGLCGLEAFSPTSSCESGSITMGEDGTLTVIRGNDIVFEMQGDACEDGSCVPGLVIDEDGKMKIGGVNGKVTVKPTVDLQPWPFTDDVTIPGKKKGRKI